MTDYDDNSSATNCMCDGADDAMYTCEYHSEHHDEYGYSTAFERMFPSVSALDDLVDAYGPRHYKTGVYDVC